MDHLTKVKTIHLPQNNAWRVVAIKLFQLIHRFYENFTTNFICSVACSKIAVQFKPGSIGCLYLFSA